MQIYQLSNKNNNEIFSFNNDHHNTPLIVITFQQQVFCFNVCIDNEMIEKVL